MNFEPLVTFSLPFSLIPENVSLGKETMKKKYRIEITLDWPETNDPKARPDNIAVKVDGKRLAAIDAGQRSSVRHHARASVNALAIDGRLFERCPMLKAPLSRFIRCLERAKEYPTWIK
jgi:hypothetical protein